MAAAAEEAAAAAAAARAAAPAPPTPAKVERAPAPDPAAAVDAAVSKLVTALYYARVFSDASNPHGAAVAALERAAAASYADTDGGPPLPVEALTALAAAGDAMAAREAGALVSHADAVAACAAAARAFAARPPARLDAVLARLTALEYCSVTPRLMRVGEAGGEGKEEGGGAADDAPLEPFADRAPPLGFGEWPPSPAAGGAYDAADPAFEWGSAAHAPDPAPAALAPPAPAQAAPAVRDRERRPRGAVPRSGGGGGGGNGDRGERERGARGGRGRADRRAPRAAAQ